MTSVRTRPPAEVVGPEAPAEPVVEPEHELTPWLKNEERQFFGGDTAGLARDLAHARRCIDGLLNPMKGFLSDTDVLTVRVNEKTKERFLTVSRAMVEATQCPHEDCSANHHYGPNATRRHHGMCHRRHHGEKLRKTLFHDTRVDACAAEYQRQTAEQILKDLHQANLTEPADD